LRLILDTNLLISPFLADTDTPPSQLIDAWLDQTFELICSEAQIDEFRRVSRYPDIRRRVKPSNMGTFVNLLRAKAIMVTPVPGIEVCDDPDDDYLLGMAQAGTAEYLVSGDRQHILPLETWHSTQIVTARKMVDILKL
jgi:hypothetical protein